MIHRNNFQIAPGNVSLFNFKVKKLAFPKKKRNISMRNCLKARNSSPFERASNFGVEMTYKHEVDVEVSMSMSILTIR
jgi:hypothetical protein